MTVDELLDVAKCYGFTSNVEFVDTDKSDYMAIQFMDRKNGETIDIIVDDYSTDNKVTDAVLDYTGEFIGAKEIIKLRQSMENDFVSEETFSQLKLTNDTGKRFAQFQRAVVNMMPVQETGMEL